MQKKSNIKAGRNNFLGECGAVIEEYPSFTTLKLEHRRIFDQFGRKYGHYCDFDFVDLFSWDLDSNTGVALLNGNLVLRRSDYLTGKMYFSIFGNKKIDDSLISLLHDAKELELVPEIVIDNIKNKSQFMIKDHRDSHDYIYNVSDLANLSGSKYKNVRNKLNTFLKEYKDIDLLKTISLNHISYENSKKLLQIFHTWGETKGLSKDNINRELTAFRRLLKYADRLNLLTIVIYRADELVAFSVNHIAEPGYAITHFEKVKKIHRYFNTYVVHEVAKEQHRLRCFEVNWEDDLGFHGLRQNKKSYCPKKMLKKYNIKMKQNK